MNDSIMTMETGFGIIDWIPLLITMVPFVLVIWFMITFINLQKERNKILRKISDKLDK
ncbi:hypothetical protein ACIQXI_04895 [Lysinibacillus sp. NPDC097195]|uniref:hypothetical protein n=1 Tax=Lysinibacillus sp. NPDC097195 TaxID=3364141 RepID=UPI0037F9C0D8